MKRKLTLALLTGLLLALMSVSVQANYTPLGRLSVSGASGFGSAVAMDPVTNNIAVAEASGESVYIYDESGGSFDLVRDLSNPGSSTDDFGAALAMYNDVLVVGAPQALNSLTDPTGVVYVYVYNFLTGEWPISPNQTIEGSFDTGEFGASVALDNGILAVGAPNAGMDAFGQAYVYRYDSLNSQFVASPEDVFSGSEPNSGFGFSVAVDGANDPPLVAVGAPFQLNGSLMGGGAVYVYEYTAGDPPWPLRAGPLQLETLEFSVAPNADDNVGWDVDISGNWLAAGGPGIDNGGELDRGMTLVWQYIPGLGYDSIIAGPFAVEPGGAEAGTAIAFGPSDTSIPDILMGAPYADSDIGENTGQVVGIDLSDVQAFSLPIDAVSTSGLGFSIAASVDKVIVGAPDEDSGQGGVYTYFFEAPAGDDFIINLPEQEADENLPLNVTISADSGCDFPVSFSLDDGSEGEVPPGASITPVDNITATLSWTPDDSFGGQTVIFDVVGEGCTDPASTDSETITVTVSEDNQAPVLDAIGPINAPLNQELSFTASATDADLPEQTLSYSLSESEFGSVPTGATINSESGLFTWTPDTPGSYSFDLVVQDDGSPSPGFDFQTLDITVYDPTENQPPLLAESGMLYAKPSRPFRHDVIANDPNTADALTFSLDDGVSGSVPDGLAIDSTTGILTWTPIDIGEYTFDVVVGDDNSTFPLKDVQTLTITVGTVVPMELLVNRSFEQPAPEDANPKEVVEAWRGVKLTNKDKIKKNKDKNGDGIIDSANDRIVALAGNRAVQFGGSSFDARRFKQRHFSDQNLDVDDIELGDTLVLNFNAKAKGLVGNARVVLKAIHPEPKQPRGFLNHRIKVTIEDGTYDYQEFSGQFVIGTEVNGTPVSDVARVVIVVKYREPNIGKPRVFVDDVSAVHYPASIAPDDDDSLLPLPGAPESQADDGGVSGFRR